MRIPSLVRLSPFDGFHPVLKDDLASASAPSSAKWVGFVILVVVDTGVRLGEQVSAIKGLQPANLDQRQEKLSSRSTRATKLFYNHPHAYSLRPDPKGALALAAEGCVP